MTPGLNGSITTSALLQSFLKTCLPLEDLRSSAMDRFPRARPGKKHMDSQYRGGCHYLVRMQANTTWRVRYIQLSSQDASEHHMACALYTNTHLGALYTNTHLVRYIQTHTCVGLTGKGWFGLIHIAWGTRRCQRRCTGCWVCHGFRIRECTVHMACRLPVPHT